MLLEFVELVEKLLVGSVVGSFVKHRSEEHTSELQSPGID
jgi:hypothetical protein